MAIEDEDGYDKTTADLCLESYLRHMTTYFEPFTGASLEGELKTAFALSFAPLYGRRYKRHSLQYRGVERFFKCFVPSIYHPNGKLAFAGAGTITNNGVIQGKWDSRGMYYPEAVLAAHFFPDSGEIRNMFGLLAGHEYVGGAQRGFGPSGWAPVELTSFCFLPANLEVCDIGREFWNAKEGGHNSSAPLCNFSSERGLLVARSTNRDDALFLYSEFMSEERGHNYLHAGAFAVLSDEVTWIQRYSEEGLNRFGLLALEEDGSKIVGQKNLGGCFVTEVVDSDANFSSICGDIRCRYVSGIHTQVHRSWYGKPEEIVSFIPDPRREKIHWRFHNKASTIRDRRELQMYTTGQEHKNEWQLEEIKYPPQRVAELEDLPVVAYRTATLVRGTRPMVLVTFDHARKTPTKYRLRLPLDSAVYMDAPTSIDQPGIDMDEKLSETAGNPVVCLRPASDPNSAKRCLVAPIATAGTTKLEFKGGVVEPNTVAGDTPNPRWTFAMDFDTVDPIDTFRLCLVLLPFDVSDPVSKLHASETACELGWANGDNISFVFDTDGCFSSTRTKVTLADGQQVAINHKQREMN